MDLSLQSIVKTLIVLIVIFGCYFGIQLVLRLCGLNSNKAKFSITFCVFIALLVTKYLEYPFAHLIGYLTGRVSLQHIDHGSKTALWLFVAIMITSGLDYFVWDGIDIRNNRKRKPRLLTNTLNLVIYFLIALIIIRAVYGINVSNLLAASGVGAFILGFSSKSTLEELIAGISIQFTGRIKQGSYIKHNENSGLVEDFFWKNISIIPVTETGHVLHHQRYVIPNHALINDSYKIIQQPDDSYLMITGFYQTSPYIDTERLMSIFRSLLLEHASEDDISVRIASHDDNEFRLEIDSLYTVRFKLFVKSLEEKRNFFRTFNSCLINRVLKAGLPISRLKPSWPIVSEQPPLAQCQPETPSKAIITQCIEQCSILTHLTDQQKQTVIDQCKTQYFVSGEYIMHQRVDDEHRLFLILQGNCQAYELTDNEHPVAMGSFSPCDVFGLQAFLLDTPRRISVRATQPTWCLEFCRGDMKPLFEQTPEIIDRFSQLLAERCQNNKDLLESSITVDIANKETVQSVLKKKIKELFIR